MTEYLAPTDPYTLSFEATVESVEGHEVVLDHTYFYAESGGQSPDRGRLDGIEVTDVQKDGDAVVHELADAPDSDPGETVPGEVDPAFRTYCMRAHTASHVLYGAGRRLLDDLGYGGFDITSEKVRVDFTTSTDVDDATLAELERLVNRAVWESRPVTWRSYPREEALSMDEIAFNTKTEEGLEGERVRVVTVGDATDGGVVAPEGGAVGGDRTGGNGTAGDRTGGNGTAGDRTGGNGTAGDPTGGDPGTADDPWDEAACGGTHVANTREIGPVTVLDRSNPGKGMTRIEIAVGPTGIRRRAEEKRALLEAGNAASAPPGDIADAIAGLRETNEELEARIEDFQDRLVETQLRGARDNAFARDGARWIVGEVEGADATALGEHAKACAGADAGVVVLVGASGRTFVVVAADEGDAEGIVEAVTEEFGGGGGGSAAFAQAGGIDADPGSVVEFLRKDLR